MATWGGVAMAPRAVAETVPSVVFGGDSAAELPTGPVQPATSRRLPGEFERQRYLLLSTGDLTPTYATTIAEIAAMLQHHIRVVVFYTTSDQAALVHDALAQRLDDLQDIALVAMPHDSRWIRDFGPTVVRQGALPLLVDWSYDEGRPNDDRVPAWLGLSSQTLVEPANLTLEGGNLLSNGQGLCITTTAMFHGNAHRELDEIELCRQLSARVGAREVVVLEALLGEPTGHIDMFATFTAPNRVVVGQFEPQQDEENAAILDRNAERLSELVTPLGRMVVERIPMGRSDDGMWRTYTNCIYANGVLLVPSYQRDEVGRGQRAFDVYQQLLPHWQIIPIDATALIEEGGALHCVALNVPELAQPIQPVAQPAAGFQLNGLPLLRQLD